MWMELRLQTECCFSKCSLEEEKRLQQGLQKDKISYSNKGQQKKSALASAGGTDRNLAGPQFAQHYRVLNIMQSVSVIYQIYVGSVI